VPAFLKVDPFDRLTPMPSVYYYLWHKILQRGSASQRLLSDYPQAVAITEWAAANAATWIHQAALGRRMMRLPAEVQAWFRQLGYSAPLVRTAEPWPVVDITPAI